MVDVVSLLLVNASALGLAYPAARGIGAIVITRCNLAVSDMVYERLRTR